MNKAGIEYSKKHISSHGYVKVYIGRDNPKADSSGYAYEHRMVAEQILGRDLKPSEIVHHADGNRANNDPRNIGIHSSIRHHLNQHRSPDSSLQKLNESNCIVMCGCGCEGTFLKYDKSGRPRKFITGHNKYLLGPRQQEVLDIIKKHGRISRKEIARLCNTKVTNIAQAMCRLNGKELILAKGGGIWEIRK